MKPKTTALATILIAAIANAQTVVDGVFLQHPLDTFAVPAQPEPASYADIPGTAKTITLPTGKATITWDVRFQTTSTTAWVRPIIGTLAPDEGFFLTSQGLLTWQGMWTVDVEAGTFNVRLQVRNEDTEGDPFGPSPLSFQDRITWSIVAAPTVAQGTPSVSTWGLLVLLLGIVSAATVRMIYRGIREVP